MFRWIPKNAEDIAPTAWESASALRRPLDRASNMPPRSRGIGRVIEALRVNDRSKHRMTQPAAPRPVTASTVSDNVHQELQVRALRDQFKAVEPESLCVPGGMTRDEYIKFLTILREAILRDAASDKG
jgi:hypothetical protein